MTINRTEVEVRYQETDQMGVVYHANYLVWFEIGRTKYIEELGFKYTEMESSNIVSPVLDAQISFKKPARYGDKVFVETWLENYDGIRTTYGYQVINAEKEVFVTGSTVHVIVTKDTFKPALLRRVNREWHEAYLNEMNREV